MTLRWRSTESSRVARDGGEDLARSVIGGARHSLLMTDGRIPSLAVVGSIPPHTTRCRALPASQTWRNFTTAVASRSSGPGPRRRRRRWSIGQADLPALDLERARRRRVWPMRYHLLGQTGLFVSEMCLGTMTFGGGGMWTAIGTLGAKEAEDLVAIRSEER